MYSNAVNPQQRFYYAKNERKCYMYIYPDNMKGKAGIFLWSLNDLIIIVIGAVIGITAAVSLKIMFPAALAAAFAFLTIRFDDTSIFDYIINAFKFCISTQQMFIWRCSE